MSNRMRKRIVFLLITIGALVIFLNIFIQRSSTNGPRHRSNKFTNENSKYESHPNFAPRDIHVVIGYYQGNNLPWIHSDNLTDDVLNENMFSPDPIAGRNGEAVLIPSFEAPKMNKLFQVNRYNLMASDRIPLDRTLPDVRRPLCRNKTYDLKLTTSVIIAWSALLRTVHSVLNRSPAKNLKEIILVDDASQRLFLGSNLDTYLKSLEKERGVSLKILRSLSRIGLIKARLLGAKEAQGDVLTFLDAHCECTQGWLDALLSRIEENRKVVVSPVIDIINDETFQYVRSFELHQGGFNWDLHFRWFSLPSHLISQRQADPTKPFSTPVIAGGLFAIDRKFFYEIGSYDEKMEIWGGENLEISFRVWMCGGQLEIVPCSHVGHLFRKSSPYTFGINAVRDILNANLARVALVWMDEWKKFYFKLNPEVGAMASNQSVESRLALRSKLECKNFEWYLNNIWPSHFFPTHNEFFGRMRNLASNKCLQSPVSQNQSQPYGPATIGTCIVDLYRPQLFILNKDGYIKTDDSICVDSPDFNSQSPQVGIMACNTISRQRWEYDKSNNLIKHRASSNKCLAIGPKAPLLTLSHCNKEEIGQKWKLEPIEWS